MYHGSERVKIQVTVIKICRRLQTIVIENRVYVR